MKTKPALSTITLATITAMFTLLTACSGGAGNGADFASNDNPPPNSNDTKPDDIVAPDPANYTISGTVTGLLAGHKVKLLSNSTNEEIEIAQDGTFKFTQSVKENTNYQISVKNHPIWRWCDVDSKGTGIATSNITDIAIVCDDARGNVETLNNVTVTAPTSIAIDSLDNVYIADKTGKKIIKLKPDGATEQINLTYEPSALHVDLMGNIFTIQPEQHYVKLRKHTPDPTDPSGYKEISSNCDECDTLTPDSVTDALAVDKYESIYVMAKDKWALTKTPKSKFGTNQTTDIFFDSAQTGIPFTQYQLGHIAMDSQYNVYLTDYGQSIIFKILADGTASEIYAGIQNSSDASNAKIDKRSQAKFASPYGIAADKFGNLYVSDNQEYANDSRSPLTAKKNNAIRIITADGRVRTLAGSANSGLNDGIAEVATFNNPHGVAVDSRGYIYVADKGNNKIRRITPVK